MPPLRHLLNKFRATPTDSYDVCIVGSGFAGTCLGLGLIAQNIRTAIVDAGIDLPTGASNDGRVDLFPHVASGDAPFPVDFNRSIATGGTSRKWNGVVSRFMPSDFKSHSMFGLFADWPIAYDDLRPYYAEAEALLEIEPPREDWPPRPSFPAAADPLELFPLSFSGTKMARGPVRLHETTLRRFAESPHGRLIADSPVTRVLMDKNDTATGVEVRHLDGRTETIRAGIVVVAAGVVESARLLLSSTSTACPRGIGNNHDLLGRFVHIHPRPRLHVPRADVFADATSVYRSFVACDGFRRQGLAAVCVDFNFYEAEPSVDLHIEMEPARENRVSLSGTQHDRWGRPIALVHLSGTDIDRRTNTAAVDLQRTLAKTVLGLRGEGREAEFKCFHPAGGCRMGFSPADGVVDVNGLVFGTRNVYVTGASVFPTSGALNPTLTVIALALRMGDHLSRPR